MGISFGLRKEGGIIYDYNTNCCTINGLSEDVRQIFSDFLVIDNITTEDIFIKKLANELIEMRDKEEVLRFEHEFYLLDQYRYFFINGKYNKEKNIFIGIIVDDTPNFNMKLQTIQAEKLRSLGALAGGIAHDFNNQLMVILGNCELLKRHLKDEKNIKYLNSIEHSARNSTELIEKLRTFGHVDTIEKKPFNLISCIKETISIVEHTSDTKVKIYCESKSTSIGVNANYTMIQNALLNLCKNSLESVDENGGLLIVSAGEVFLDKLPIDSITSQFTPGKYAYIKIADNGCGIEPSKIGKIFDPFFSTKTFDKGTGLGLSTVLGTINSHNGLVSVSSIVNQGTLFTIYLNSLEFEEELEISLDKKKKEIMLIDDDYLVRMVLRDILDDLGYEVSCFSNGLEAIEYYKKNIDNVSLVVSDMMMPEMNGKEVFLKLKELNPLVKFIILSGYSSENNEDIMDSLVAYLKKPLLVHELEEILEKSLK